MKNWSTACSVPMAADAAGRRPQKSAQIYCRTARPSRRPERPKFIPIYSRIAARRPIDIAMARTITLSRTRCQRRSLGYARRHQLLHIVRKGETRVVGRSKLWKRLCIVNAAAGRRTGEPARKNIEPGLPCGNAAHAHATRVTIAMTGGVSRSASDGRRVSMRFSPTLVQHHRRAIRWEN